MNKNIIHRTLFGAVALLLLIVSTSASATILGCWKGQAWQSTDGGNTWTEAGGCSGGPWVIEYGMEPYDEPSDMTDGEVFESIDTFKEMMIVDDRETGRPRSEFNNGLHKRRAARTGRNPQTGATFN